jgi:hypothetical protein
MEQATVIDQPEGLVGVGCQVGVDPGPYSVRYELRLNPAGIAERFVASSRTLTASRQLTMRRAADGSWTLVTGGLPDGPPPPEEDGALIAGALDIDLGYSPLFNSTPVLRDGLLAEGAPARDYLMAWVSVPDLAVTASPQRYEPLGREGDLRVVRYTNLDSGYTARISFDPDGFVVDYEDFLKRIAAERLPAAGIDA